MDNPPLVSVIVMTYNSAKFLVETLNSVCQQEYSNIELIVSDDCSTDGTLSIAADWLSQNGSRFKRTELLTVRTNTGVSANCNRSIAAAKADWIKFIAGDDILFPNCIRDNIAFVSSNSDVRVLFSYVEVFTNRFCTENLRKRVPATFPNNIMHPLFDACHQYKLLLMSDRISFTPSYFFYKPTIAQVGGYSEEFRMVEDYPMWLKLTKAGVKLHFMESATVGYRQHAASINNREGRRLFSPAFLLSEITRDRLVYSELPWDIAGRARVSNGLALLFNKLGLNRDTLISRHLYRLLAVYLNPFRYIIFLRKRLVRRLQGNVFYN